MNTVKHWALYVLILWRRYMKFIQLLSSACESDNTFISASISLLHQMNTWLWCLQHQIFFVYVSRVVQRGRSIDDALFVIYWDELHVLVRGHTVPKWIRFEREQNNDSLTRWTTLQHAWKATVTTFVEQTCKPAVSVLTSIHVDWLCWMYVLWIVHLSQRLIQSKVSS